MSKLSYTQRAANGAALLDQHQPGWAQKVNVDVLDISSGLDCPLGQVYGTWALGLDHLTVKTGEDAWSGKFQSDHGFNFTPAEQEYGENDIPNWEVADKWLCKRWAAEVTKRKEL